MYNYNYTKLMLNSCQTRLILHHLIQLSRLVCTLESLEWHTLHSRHRPSINSSLICIHILWTLTSHSKNFGLMAKYKRGIRHTVESISAVLLQVLMQSHLTMQYYRLKLATWLIIREPGKECNQVYGKVGHSRCGVGVSTKLANQQCYATLSCWAELLIIIVRVF